MRFYAYCPTMKTYTVRTNEPNLWRQTPSRRIKKGAVSVTLPCAAQVSAAYRLFT